MTRHLPPLISPDADPWLRDLTDASVAACEAKYPDEVPAEEGHVEVPVVPVPVNSQWRSAWSWTRRWL